MDRAKEKREVERAEGGKGEGGEGGTGGGAGGEGGPAAMLMGLDTWQHGLWSRLPHEQAEEVEVDGLLFVCYPPPKPEAEAKEKEEKESVVEDRKESDKGAQGGKEEKENEEMESEESVVRMSDGLARPVGDEVAGNGVDGMAETTTLEASASIVAVM
jgi:hypothetical protein